MDGNMTHDELAEVLMEIEGQRRALEEHGFKASAERFSLRLGQLCSNNIVMIVASLKFWDVSISLAKEMIEEAIQIKKPKTPAEVDLKKIQWPTTTDH